MLTPMAVKLPAVGIVLGPIAAPRTVIGLTTKPCNVSLIDWLGNLADRGCHLRITPTTSFLGSYVECPGDGPCSLRSKNACPLDPH